MRNVRPAAGLAALEGFAGRLGRLRPAVPDEDPGRRPARELRPALGPVLPILLWGAASAVPGTARLSDVNVRSLLI